MFVQGYGMKGFATYFLCQLNWFIIMNDFGFPPFQLLYSNGIFIFLSDDSDSFNPTDPYYGNTLLKTAVDNKSVTTCSQFDDGS